MNETPRSLRDLAMAASERHPRTSDRELARMAAMAGHEIVGTTISAIKKGTYRSRPNAKTLDALAWLAGWTREQAYLAAGQTLVANPFASELPPGVDQLTAKQRAAVVAVTRAMLDPGKGVVEPQTPPAEHADQIYLQWIELGFVHQNYLAWCKARTRQEWMANNPPGSRLGKLRQELETYDRDDGPPPGSEPAIVDTDPEASERDRMAVDDDLYAAYMRGEGGFDPVTTRRLEARAEREAARNAASVPDRTTGVVRDDGGPEGYELAARHQPGFQGERLARESDELGEGPDPEGPEGGA